jgi:hypothetical protein
MLKGVCDITLQRTPRKIRKTICMKLSCHNQRYFQALHDVFTIDYHEINHYVLELYLRPQQFIKETGPTFDRFLREYTLPGIPRPADMPTGVILDFIGQIDEFTTETTLLFDEHKTHVGQCAKYMEKVTAMKNDLTYNADKITPALTDITSELVYVHEGLKRIKEKAASMTEKLEKLETRWATMKEVINR